MFHEAGCVKFVFLWRRKRFPIDASLGATRIAVGWGDGRLLCATAAPNVALLLPLAPSAPTAAPEDAKRGKMVIGQEPCNELMGWGFKEKGLQANVKKQVGTADGRR